MSGAPHVASQVQGQGPRSTSPSGTNHNSQETRLLVSLRPTPMGSTVQEGEPPNEKWKAALGEGGRPPSPPMTSSTQSSMPPTASS